MSLCGAQTARMHMQRLEMPESTQQCGQRTNHLSDALSDQSYNHTMNPNRTPASPMLIPAISLPPLALPFFVAVADALDAVPVGVAPVPVARLRLWPTVGNGGFPLINQPPGVDDGHVGGVRLLADAEYVESATPDGLRVAHWLFKF